MASEEDIIEIAALELFESALKQNIAKRLSWISQQDHIPKNIRGRAKELITIDLNQAKIFQTGQALQNETETLEPPERIGAYKITGLIGRGGMGAVYKGERDVGDFNHVVAIKVIRTAALSDKLVLRFETERQMLAGLVHPNIARLYDGGTLESRAPYIIMEYIEGQSITSWADKVEASLEARLDLFLAACRAVSYAHQNLVIHRDITPSNVLVDVNNDVKLIDFGIAKPHGENANITDGSHSLASLSFTPGFAAPERSKGAGANTLSDIYSLGKLLSALLEPYSISDELISIINKTIQIDPQDRYKTVDALMTDITQYQTGHVVTAHKNSKLYALKKFISRQKIGVSLGALAAASLLGGIITTSVLYTQAVQAKKDALTRFDEVRSVANFMLFDLYDELQPIPGNTKALEKISQKSQQYLERLSEIREDDFDLEMEAIEGYQRLANITGNPFLYNLGRQQDATNIYEETQNRLNLLIKKYPNNPRILKALAAVSYDKASLEYTRNTDYEAALVLINQGLEYVSQIEDLNEISITEKKLEVSLINLKGSCTLGIDKGQEAVDLFRRFEPKITAWLAGSPDDIDVKKSVAEFYHIYAFTVAWHIYLKGEDDALALPFYNRSVNIYLEIIEKNPDFMDARISLALIYSRRAETYVELEDYAAALADNNKAADILNDAKRLDPNDQYVKQLTIINGKGLMTVNAIQGNRDPIVKIASEIIALQRESATDNPGDIGYIRLLSNTLLLSGEALLDINETDLACEYIREGTEHINEFAKVRKLNEADKINVLDAAIELSEKCKNK